MSLSRMNEIQSVTKRCHYTSVTFADIDVQIN